MQKKQRGRPSIAALTVAPLGPVRQATRLAPPQHLTPPEREAWLTVINSLPAATFAAHHGPLLEAFCRHTVHARILAAEVQKFKPAWLVHEEGLRRYDKLLAMHGRETSLLASMATKLRLSRQAIDKKVAARMETSEPSSSPPWKVGDD